jgi:hypothetical protein
LMILTSLIALTIYLTSSRLFRQVEAFENTPEENCSCPVAEQLLPLTGRRPGQLPPAHTYGPGLLR